jgi:DNA-binding SARP family transcriptional activator
LHCRQEEQLLAFGCFKGTAMTTIRILGPVEAGAGRQALHFGRRKQLKLFAFLVVNANKAVSNDALIDAVWGSAGSGAGNKLHMAITRLRQVLEPLKSEGTELLTVGGGYRLTIRPGELDADLFKELIADSHRALEGGDPERAVELLNQALLLWRGPPLADVGFEDFAQEEIRLLEGKRVELLETRADANLQLGRHAEVTDELDALLRGEPTREHVAELLILALYRSGRQADALDVYQRVRASLNEIGLSPGARLGGLQAEILAQAGSPDGLARETDHSQHSAHAEDASRAAVPLPSRLAPYGPATFVGREHESEVLSRALTGTTVSGRRAAFVTGEAGIGKTRLVSELASQAHASGTLVLAGRCDEGLDLPYQPFAEALEHYIEHADTELLRSYVEAYGVSLIRIVPELAARLSEPPPPASERSEAEPYVLYRAIEGLLSTASKEGPALLVLEDLHWADVPTVKLLRRLLTSTRRSPLMLLSTCRLTELDGDDPLRQLLTDVYRQPHVVRLDLTGLETRAVAQLVRAMTDELPAGADEPLARALQTGTNGNPFFITELMQSLVESGALVDEQGRWQTFDEFEVGDRLPTSISDTLARRLRRLSDPVQHCLSAAAVLGVEFDLDLVGAVSEVDDAPAALDAAVAHGILIEVPDRQRRVRFVHALMQRYLYGELGPHRRAELHRRIARALAAMRRPGKAPVAELAWHWLHTDERGAKSARKYSILAGDEALEKLAPTQALRWYETASELLDGDPGATKAQRCDLLLKLGVAMRQAGDSRSREMLLRAAEIARQIGDRERLAASALANTRGMQSETGIVDADRIATLQDALAVIGSGDSPERARLLAMQGAELMYSGQWDRRVKLSDEALAIGRRLDDRGALIAVLNLRFVTLLAPDTLAERRANTVEAVPVAEALSDPLARFYAYHWRAYACIEAGEITDARAWAAREREIADRYRQPTMLWLSCADEANLAIIAGELETAEHLAGTALEVGRQSEPDALACYAAQRTSIAFEAGQANELRPLLEQAVSANPGVPGFRATLALALAEDSRPDGAQTILDEAASSNFDELPYDVTWLAAICIYAHVSARLQDADAAGRLYGLLAPWRLQVAFPAFGVWGPVELYLGALALAIGDLPAAAGHLSRARNVAHRASAPLWEARIAALGKLL